METQLSLKHSKHVHFELLLHQRNLELTTEGSGGADEAARP